MTVQPPFGGKDAFHSVPFVPLWETVCGKRCNGNPVACDASWAFPRSFEAGIYLQATRDRVESVLPMNLPICSPTFRQLKAVWQMVVPKGQAPSELPEGIRLQPELHAATLGSWGAMGENAIEVPMSNQIDRGAQAGGR